MPAVVLADGAMDVEIDPAMSTRLSSYVFGLDPETCVFLMS